MTPVRERSDSELIAAIRGGEEDAWRGLVDRYRRLVFTVARRHHLGEDACGDVFDGVFAELWRALGTLERPEQVRSWLVTVARRKSLAYLEQQRRWVSLSDPDAPSLEPADPAPAAESIMIESEREQAMRMALATLSPRCRELLEWLFYTEPPPSYEELARRMSVSPNSVGFIRSRCLIKLRAALEAELSKTGVKSTGVGSGM